VQVRRFGLGQTASWLAVEARTVEVGAVEARVEALLKARLMWAHGLEWLSSFHEPNQA
jgi:hypothetical protein